MKFKRLCDDCSYRSDPIDLGDFGYIVKCLHPGNDFNNPGIITFTYDRNRRVAPSWCKRLGDVGISDRVVELKSVNMTEQER